MHILWDFLWLWEFPKNKVRGFAGKIPACTRVDKNLHNWLHSLNLVAHHLDEILSLWTIFQYSIFLDPHQVLGLENLNYNVFKKLCAKKLRPEKFLDGKKIGVQEMLVLIKTKNLKFVTHTETDTGSYRTKRIM